MSESNIFAEQDRKRAEDAERWGLSGLSSMDRGFIEIHAIRIISEKSITDDEEKRKVYDDVKRQYLEHKETRITSRMTLKDRQCKIGD